MKISIKHSVLAALVAFATPLTTSVVFAQATVVGPVEESEQVIAETDSIVAESELYGEGFMPFISQERIQDRIGCLEQTIHLEYNRSIQQFIEFFVVKKRKYTKTMVERKDYYFPIFEYYLKKHNLPEELKYLSVVESGLNPRAVSRVGAGGLWQFMPGTGRDFRLFQDGYVDERLDPYKSTEAACKYLKQLYNLFGDWELALASYNCGPGNVRRAIRRSGNKTGFWEIYDNLPRETRSYVPQFVALTYVMNYAGDYMITSDSPEQIIPFDTIHINQRHVDLELLSKHINTPLEDLRKLNPHLKKNVVPGYLKNYPLRIPSDRYDLVNTNRVAILDSSSKVATAVEMEMVLASNTTKASSSHSGVSQKKVFHKVKKGEAISRIADRYNVSVSQLKSWNHLRSSKLKYGQNLAIWVEKKQPADKSSKKKVAEDVTVKSRDEASLVADIKPIGPQPDATAVAAADEVKVDKSVAKKQSASKRNSERAKAVAAKYHTVQKGDTLWSISQRYGGVPVEKIRKLNKLKGNELKPGQKLIVG